MAKVKSTFGSLIITLAVITFVGSLSLGFVFDWTQEPIAKAQMAKQLKAIEAVLDGYDNNPVMEKYKVAIPNGKDSLEFFPATRNGKRIGTAVKTKSSKGYSGDIWLMVGFNEAGDVLRVQVLEHKETPGLGSKMSQPNFLNQYFGKNPGKNNLKVKKDGGEVDAITGATISSRAFSEAVQLAYETFQSVNHGN
ncbi:MAG: RnfABCDGE type electron transport complex subunit G [Cyclobacteriaceae bacterium]|nr:RnfABCDGE type electron transport complex subunit G [Cyclobacteriaceae bacterium]MBX2955009.1 RnfABCDGE type electron transport complex subunit G [Cyclobacteriaceae bacterium]